MSGFDFQAAAMLSMGFWLFALILHFLPLKDGMGRRLSMYAGLAGSLVMAVFIGLYWMALQRPPLRTLGETRLWYGALIPIVGFLVEYRWRIAWLKFYCMGLAAMFLSINLMHPEVFDKTLMPALQSVWFVPHVVVYLIGYVLLAASSASAWHNLYLLYARRRAFTDLSHYLAALGFVLLTFGLIFGALWAKEAWGHYWTWDPKETWAFIAWLIYLGYLHAWSYRVRPVLLQWFLGLAFLVLLVSWFGVNYLPTATNSVHSYAN